MRDNSNSTIIRDIIVDAQRDSIVLGQKIDINDPDEDVHTTDSSFEDVHTTDKQVINSFS